MRKQPIRLSKRTMYWLSWIFGRVGVSLALWWRQSSRALLVNCHKWSLPRYKRIDTSRQPLLTIFAACQRWLLLEIVKKSHVNQARYQVIKSSNGCKAYSRSISQTRLLLLQAIYPNTYIFLQKTVAIKKPICDLHIGFFAMSCTILRCHTLF